MLIENGIEREVRAGKRSFDELSDRIQAEVAAVVPEVRRRIVQAGECGERGGGRTGGESERKRKKESKQANKQRKKLDRKGERKGGRGWLYLELRVDLDG